MTMKTNPLLLFSAVCALWSSALSAQDEVPPVPPDAPAAPSGLSIQAVNDTTVRISWPTTTFRYCLWYGDQPSVSAQLLPAPLTSDPGASEILVAGLKPLTRYTFVLRAWQGNFNFSNPSPALTITTPASAPPEKPASDLTPPITVSDLLLRTPESKDFESLELSWTAPGDDLATGIASRYEIRYSTAPVTSTTWSSATLLATLPAPEPAGTKQHLRIPGLRPDTIYYTALRSMDDAGNTSEISNLAFARTAREPALTPSEPETPPIPTAAVAFEVPRTVSTTGPLSVSGKAPEGWNVRRGKLRIRLANGGIQEIDLTLSESGGTFSLHYSLDGLDPSAYELQIVLILEDEKGSSREETSDLIRIDSTPPLWPADATLRLMREGREVFATGSRRWEIEWSPAADPESSVVRYELALGTEPGVDNLLPWGKTVIAGHASSLTQEAPVPDEGSYYLSIRAVNSLGKFSPILVSSRLSYDTTKPGALFLVTPPAIDTALNVSFAFGSTETGCRFRSHLDNWGWNDHGLWTRASYSGLNRGEHVLKLIATDAAGNESDPVEYRWTIR